MPVPSGSEWVPLLTSRCLAKIVAAGYRLIARVVKTHGTKGEVVAVPAGGLPPVLSAGLRVAVVPPALKGKRWHKVVDVETSPAGQLVALSGIRSLGDASELTGKYLIAVEDDLPDDLELHDPQQLCGREVVDGRLGLLGTIDEVMVGPANDVWVVQGDLGETLVPVVEEMLDGVDEDGTIYVNIPVGLAPWDDGSDDEDGED